MQRTKWGFITLFALLVIVVGFMLTKSNEQPPRSVEPQTVATATDQAPAPVPGHPAPDFTLADFNGTKVTLHALQGKPLLLNFWASWCPPCRQEMPDLAKKAEQYKGKVQFYGVNLTVQDHVDAAKAFAKSAGVQFPMLLDQAGDAARAYQVQAIPTTFLINAKGVIVEVIPGGMTADVMEKVLQQLSAQ